MTLNTDKATDVKVTFGAVLKCSALDDTIGMLSPVVDRCELDI